MPFQTLDVPFGALDTKTDERMLANGALLAAENCSAQTVGGYRKRFGYTALTAGSNIIRLAAYRETLCRVTDFTGTVQAWDVVTSTWNSLGGTVALCKTAQENVSVRANVDSVRMTCAVANGLKVDAWIDSANNIYVAISNVADGTRIKVQTLTSIVGSSIRAVAVGSNVYVVYSGAGAQLIIASFVNCTTATIGAATTLFSGANVDATNAQFDLCALNSTDVVLAWKPTAGEVRAARITASTHTVNANQQVAAEAPDGPIAVYAESSFATALYHSTAAGGMRACCFNSSTMVQTVAPFSVEAVTSPAAVNCALASDGIGGALAVWDRAASGITKGYVQWRRWDSSGALGATQGPMRNVLLASKIARYATGGGALALINVLHRSSPQETYYTASILPVGSHLFHAMHAYRTAYPSAPVLGAVSDFATLSTGVFVWNGALGFKTLAASSANAAVSSFSCDFSAADRCSHAQVRGAMVFAGGISTKSDGRNLVEQNFLVYPEITQVAVSSVASGGMDTGTYSYVAVFEAVDVLGNTDRSTPSLAVSAQIVTGPGTGRVTVTIDQLQITRITTSPGGVAGKISVFRSIANASGDIVYRFVGSTAISQSSANTTIVDQAHDSTITSNRLLYSNESAIGQSVEREPPLPSTQLIEHKGRVWGISSADRKVLFYSGPFEVGEGPWFSSAFQMRVDPGGDITAIASMDDKLIVYKSDRIFKVYGSGPNALGQNNDLTDAILITGDAGCTDARSIVAAHGGQFFKSAKGLYALSRGEEVSYAGEAADAYWGAYANTVAANMMTDRQEIRFELSGLVGTMNSVVSGDPIPAQKLVLNYVTGQWTTHRNYLDGAALDAIVVDGIYYWTTNTTVYKENTQSFLDPTNLFVTMAIRTGWIKPAGFMGWVRNRFAMLLGNRKTAHGLSMTCENDYAGGATALKSWTNAQILTLPREQVNLHLVRQKGEAYRFTVYDVQDGTIDTGEGVHMFGLQLYAQALRGTFEKKLLAAARG